MTAMIYTLTLLTFLYVMRLISVDAQQNPSAPLQYDLLEELPAETIVGDLQEDLGLDSQYDQDDLDSMRFSISDTTRDENFKYFSVDTIGGLLKTTNRIDREVICQRLTECFVNFNVLISPAKYFQVVKVNVQILDKNDNQPTFTTNVHYISTIETTLPGTAFPLPVAIDLDTGQNTIQRYKLYGEKSNFQLKLTDNKDGFIEDIQLLLLHTLDREEQDSYTMTVVASDGGLPAQSGTMTVIVSVLDANDNSPAFENETYELNLQENTPENTVIIKLRASDPDMGKNGEIIYGFDDDTLQKYNRVFGIDSKTGDVFLRKALDYEEKDLYYLNVMAHDQGSNSLADFTRVTIRVQDMNDNEPKISLNFLASEGPYAQVLENSEVGTFVAHVKVSDPDGGPFGEVECSMQSPYFDLEKITDNAKEYKIVTRVVFDREVRGKYSASLSCTDKGEPPRQNTKEIAIRIIDENDHYPKFGQKMYTARMLENNEIGAFISRVNATDGDSDGNSVIKYELLEEVDNDIVAIDQIYGTISAKIQFDYESRQEYTFLVTATDQGTPARTATATLQLGILDTNDEPPKFSQSSYEFKIYENRPASTKIGQVTASDVDSFPFNDVTYILDPRNNPDRDLFTINSMTGVITSTREFDRELTSKYNVKVIAHNDGYEGLSSTVNVAIKINDQNDNAPVIDFPNAYNNSLRVPVDLPQGRVIARVKAHDIDSGPNAHLSYALANDNGTFRIDPRNGEIIIAAKISMMGPCGQQPCKVLVVVKDNGQPPQTTIEALHISFSTGLPQSGKLQSTVVYLNSTELTIICTVGSLVVLIIVTVIIIFTVKRCDSKGTNGMPYTSGIHDNYVEGEETSVISKCSDCSLEDADKTHEQDNFVSRPTQGLTLVPNNEAPQRHATINSPSWPAYTSGQLIQVKTIFEH